jgi:hypothetical protein
MLKCIIFMKNWNPVSSTGMTRKDHWDNGRRGYLDNRRRGTGMIGGGGGSAEMTRNGLLG